MGSVLYINARWFIIRILHACMDEYPTVCAYIGLIQSILAAALARAGKSVLHLDW